MSSQYIESLEKAGMESVLFAVLGSVDLWRLQHVITRNERCQFCAKSRDRWHPSEQLEM